MGKGLQYHPSTRCWNMRGPWRRLISTLQRRIVTGIVHQPTVDGVTLTPKIQHTVHKAQWNRGTMGPCMFIPISSGGLPGSISLCRCPPRFRVGTRIQDWISTAFDIEVVICWKGYSSGLDWGNQAKGRNDSN